MKKLFSSEFSIIGILILLILIPFFPIIFQGKMFIDDGMIYSDLTFFYYSLKVWYQNQIQMGQFPFWTNLIGNGYPIFANAELGALYPLNLIFYYFFSSVFAFKLNIILHFLLAGISTYLFARVSLKLSNASSLLAALIYALSGFFWARFSYVHAIFIISYFPFVLLLVEKIISTFKLKFVFLLGIVFTLQILAGHPEYFYYSTAFSFLFLILLLISQGAKKEKLLFGISPKIASLILFFFELVLGVSISAPQILPNMEVIKYSHRAGGLSFDASTSSVWPISALPLFVNPRIYDDYQAKKEYHPSDETTFSLNSVYGYVGVLTFFMASVASIFLFKKRLVFIFAFMTVFAFLWAQGRLSQLFTILWTIIPGVQFFRVPTKLLFTIELFLAVLAGFGFEYFKGKAGSIIKSSKTVVSISIVVILFVYGDLLFNNLRFQPLASSKDWFDKPEVASFLEKNLDKNNYQIYSHGTNNIDYISSSDEKSQKDLQNILPPAMNLAFNIPANREAFSLMLKRQQLLNAENTSLNLEKEVLGVSPAFKKSLAVQGVKYLLSDLPFDDADLTLVKEIPFNKDLSHKAFLKNGQTAKIKVTKTHVYEYNNANPRIQFVTGVRNLSGKSEEEVLNTVLSENFDPGREVILENYNGQSTLENYQSKASIKIDEYKENSTQVRVKSGNDGFLVIARTFYPGWKAFVDNQEAKIYQANFAFQAVQVPKGEHTVKFSFEPANWSISIIISIAAIIITLLGFGYSVARNK